MAKYKIESSDGMTCTVEATSVDEALGKLSEYAKAHPSKVKPHPPPNPSTLRIFNIDTGELTQIDYD